MNWYKEWYMKQTDTGIEQNVNDAEVVATYYYNIAGVKVNKPEKGLYVVKQLLKGGKTRSYKVCYQRQSICYKRQSVSEMKQVSLHPRIDNHIKYVNA